MLRILMTPLAFAFILVLSGIAPQAQATDAVSHAAAAPAPAPQPALYWQQTETGDATFHGTWAWDVARQQFNASWNNGASAALKYQRNDRDQVILTRTDYAGSSKGLTARYVGTRTSSGIEGTVEWRWGNNVRRGSWKASVQTPDARGDGQTSPIGLTRARQVFRTMAAQSDIAFRFPRDGCYARAHLMIQRMQPEGLAPMRVWSFAHPDRLHVRTANDPRAYVEWTYHVAPLLKVRGSNGLIYDMVIDPSMFKEPVTVTTWKNAQKRSPSSSEPWISRTRLGQPPLLANGRRAAGSGYWPAADPPEGIDANARRIMTAYKPYEGRTLANPYRVAVAAGASSPPVLDLGALGRPGGLMHGGLSESAGGEELDEHVEG